MNSINNAIDRAINKAHDRNWDHIYIAIDWHDTICKSTYGKTALNFYDTAVQALRMLSKRKDIVLILYTSSYNKSIQEFLDVCLDMDIMFDYINENPEITNTEYGDFNRKFYYDVLLDDKAGFDPIVDWEIILMREKWIY